MIPNPSKEQDGIARADAAGAYLLKYDFPKSHKDHCTKRNEYSYNQRKALEHGVSRSLIQPSCQACFSIRVHRIFVHKTTCYRFWLSTPQLQFVRIMHIKVPSSSRH